MDLVLTGKALTSNPDTRKILAAAAYGQVSLQINEAAPTAPLKKKALTPPVVSSSSAAASWSLSYGDSLSIGKIDAALGLVARIAGGRAPLQGTTEVEAAQVAGWLSYLWSNLDLPLQVLLVDTPKKNAQIQSEWTATLDRLEQHLTYRTYIVGHTVTTADIGLVASLDTAQAAQLVTLSESSYVNLYRLTQTLLHQPWFPALGGPLPSIGSGTSTAAVPPPPLPPVPLPEGDGVYMHGAAPPVVGRLYRRNRIRIKELLSDSATYVNTSVSVAGWARTVRKASSKLLFVAINDGSTGQSLQCVLDANDAKGFENCKTSGGTGASFAFVGTLIESRGAGQAVELQVTEAKLLGAVYAGNPEGTAVGGGLYPLSKKEHTLEHNRDVAHLRARTAVHAAAMRIRHAMAYATHNFFHNHGFLYIHTPILTGADCEGAGEQFAVTGLLGSDHHQPNVALPVHQPPEKADEKPLSKSEQKRLAKQKKKAAAAGAVDPNKPPPEQAVVGAVDYSKDFFGQRVNLTVSGQLNVETHACALSDVYTFGPTFRAEYSFTSRHLSEFWMIEPEIAFADLSDDINLAEDYLKYCVQFALTNCAEDLEFFENSPHGEKGLRARLHNVLANPFKRLTYTEAIEILQKAVAEDGVEFEEKPVWGIDLPSEHERYICEKVFQQPVVLTDYPKEIKAFYMKLNEDGKTVAAADVLVPKIGEIIGGSQREHRMDVLKQRCVESGLDPRAVWWYLDLRRYGTVPHAGFGLGFERLILFVTGLSNIRDVIPFPRWAGNAKF